MILKFKIDGHEEIQIQIVLREDVFGGRYPINMYARLQDGAVIHDERWFQYEITPELKIEARR